MNLTVKLCALRPVQWAYPSGAQPCNHNQRNRNVSQYADILILYVVG